MRTAVICFTFISYSQKLNSADKAFVDATEERAKSFRKVDIRFHVKETMIKGAISQMNGASLPMFTKSAIPPQDAVLESTNRWAIDGVQYRFENNHPMWNLNRGDKVMMRNLTTSDGFVSKSFHTDDTVAEFRPWGIIHADLKSEGIQHALAAPLSFHFRGSDRSIQFYCSKDLQLVSNGTPVGKSMCNEYALKSGQKHLFTFFVDPDSKYILRKLRISRDGNVVELYEINYSEREAFGLAPSNWNYSRFGAGGKTLCSATVIVDSISEKIEGAGDAFQLTFPSNSLVYDKRDGGRQYTVNSEGDLVELDLYGKPIATSQIEQQPGWRRDIIRWPLMITGLLIVIFVNRRTMKMRYRKNDNISSISVQSPPQSGENHV